MSDIYSQETLDFEIVKGDTAKLGFQFFEDDSGNPKQINLCECTFTVLDPISNEPIASITKTHDPVSAGGNGIYYYSDTNKPSGLGMTGSNELVVMLTDEDTNLLQENAYPFDIEFLFNNERYTPVRGTLIVKREMTPNR